jgi:hypothetical protein
MKAAIAAASKLTMSGLVVSRPSGDFEKSNVVLIPPALAERYYQGQVADDNSTPYVLNGTRVRLECIAYVTDVVAGTKRMSYPRC